MISKLTRVIFNAVAIRNTSLTNGVTADMRGFSVKTIIIESSLDQLVSLQCQASANEDFTNSFNVGASFEVSASTNTYKTCDSYFPAFRVAATCSTAPTSGTLTVYALGVR